MVLPIAGHFARGTDTGDLSGDMTRRSVEKKKLQRLAKATIVLKEEVVEQKSRQVQLTRAKRNGP